MQDFYAPLTNKKDGFELLCVFYVAEKFIEINSKNLFGYLQKRNISYKHFAASQLLTLFTSTYVENSESVFLHKVWQILLSEGWAGFFKVFVAVLKSMEEFVLVSAMEDMIVVWDSIFRSPFVQNLQGKLVFADLSERIDPRKLDRLDISKVEWTLINIEQAISSLKGNEDTVDIISEEFLAIHQKIKDILVQAKIPITNLIKDF